VKIIRELFELFVSYYEIQCSNFLCLALESKCSFRQLNVCEWEEPCGMEERSSAVIYINQTDRETKTAVNTYRTMPKRSFVASSTSVHQIERWHCDDSSVSITGMHKRRAPHVSLVEFIAVEAELRRQSASTTSGRSERDCRYLTALRP